MHNAVRKNKVAAIVLAAGKSQRMGQPKMLLPWKDSTVLETVLTTLNHSGIEKIICVLGSARQKIEEHVRRLTFPVDIVFNALYENGEMGDSIRAGFSLIEEEVDAVLIVLGDQPQMQRQTVLQILETFAEQGSALIVPSFQMRRGHPWLIGRSLWGEIQKIGPGYTMRNFLHSHQHEIHYIEVDSESILKDLDTPDDYLAETGSMLQ